MKTFLCFLTLLLLLSLPLGARTIDWGNAVGDSLFDSTGAALDDSFVFELGSFGSFVPTELNLEDWLTNWKPFDRAEAPSSSGWKSTDSFFNSTATVEDGGFSSKSALLGSFTFAEGEQAYIWAYNTQLMAYGYTEWALLTNSSLDGNPADDWTFPAPGGKTDLPLEWRVSTADGLVYGGFDDVQGPGYHAADPPSLTIQTHAVIPEPSGLLLVLSAGLLIRLRRRR